MEAKGKSKSTNKHGLYIPFYVSWIRNEDLLTAIDELGDGAFLTFIELMVHLFEKEPRRAPIDSIRVISKRIGKDEHQVAKLINDYDLFTVEDDYFYCSILDGAMERLDERRLQLSYAGKKGMEVRYGKIPPNDDTAPLEHKQDNGNNPSNNGNLVITPLVNPANNLITVKESKVDESKGKDSIEEVSKVSTGTDFFLEDRSLEQAVEEFNTILHTNSQLREYFAGPNAKKFIKYIQNVERKTNKPFYSLKYFDIKGCMIEWLKKGMEYK